jgi:hypothetical protein
MKNGGKRMKLDGKIPYYIPLCGILYSVPFRGMPYCVPLIIMFSCKMW